MVHKKTVKKLSQMFVLRNRFFCKGISCLTLRTWIGRNKDWFHGTRVPTILEAGLGNITARMKVCLHRGLWHWQNEFGVASPTTVNQARPFTLHKYILCNVYNKSTKKKRLHVFVQVHTVWVTMSFLNADGPLDFKQGQRGTWPVCRVRGCFVWSVYTLTLCLGLRGQTSIFLSDRHKICKENACTHWQALLSDKHSMAACDMTRYVTAQGMCKTFYLFVHLKGYFIVII